MGVSSYNPVSEYSVWTPPLTTVKSPAPQKTSTSLPSTSRHEPTPTNGSNILADCPPPQLAPPKSPYGDENWQSLLPWGIVRVSRSMIYVDYRWGVRITWNCVDGTVRLS